MNTMINRIVLQGFKSFNKKISIPLLKGFNVICGPNGVGKCLEGSSLIQLSDGRLLTIKEIVERALNNAKNIRRINDGEFTIENPEKIEILTLNLRNLKIENKIVTAFVKRKAPKKLLKIKTRTGKEIIATEYHPFFSIRDGRIFSTKAEELKTGLKIATPRVLPIEKSSDNILAILDKFSLEDNVYVSYSEELRDLVKSSIRRFGGKKNLSIQLGIPENVIRGVLGKEDMNIYYVSKILHSNGYDKKILDKIIQEIKPIGSHIGIRPAWRLTKDLARFLGYIIAEDSLLSGSDQVRFTNSEPALVNDFCNLTNCIWGLVEKGGKCKPVSVDLMAYSKVLGKFLERFFKIKIGSNSRVKEVPPQIFESPKEIICSFLAGLIDGDGYVEVKIDKKGKHKCYIEYSTVSRKLAIGVTTLFLRLGIVSIFKEKYKYASDTKEKKKERYYSVIISGIKNVKRFKELINPHSKDKLKALDKIENWKIEPSTNMDLIPEVNSIIKEAVKKMKLSVKKLKKISPRLQAYYENRCEATREGLSEVIDTLVNYGSLDKEASYLIDLLTLFANSDVFWDEIVSIEKIKPKEKWVYDLCIDGTHNFIANNLIVHNSNIIDAICFVLGRTSAKSLRAERLHELIFHGGNGKKPADYAAVSIYLDNTKKTFPFENEEVSVTRKVNRKGVSIYKLNGKTTTREKVLEALSAARIYPDGHNIVLQGDVTNVIEMNPVERRYIIDEISGIAEYNDKKEKASKDLEAVDAKLKEAEIVITERYDIFKRLEDERNAAVRYQQLQKQLQTLKASLAFRKLKDFEEKSKELEVEIAKKEEENEKLQKEIENIEQELEKRERGIQQVAEKIIEISKRVEVEKEISYLRTKILIDKDKIDSNRKEIERLDNLIEKLQAIESKKVEAGELPRAVKAILDQNLKEVYGTVGSLIKVPEKYQVAVETAAGHHLNDIIVESDETAKFCIDFLKREKIGRATFLPLNKIRANVLKDELLKSKNVLGVASKLIKFDPKFAAAMEFVFGNTLVVETLEAARSIGIGKVRMVTLDGDLIERSGAMVGGYYARIPRRATAKDEIEEYRMLRRKLEEDVQTFSKEVAELEKKLKEYEKSEEIKEFVDLEKLKVDSEQELDILRQKRKTGYEKRLALQTEINKLKIMKAKFEAELENLRIEIQQYGEIKPIDKAIRTLEIGIREAESELMSLGAVNFKAIEQYEKFKTEFDEYKTKYEKILEEKKAVLNMIEQIEAKRREVFNRCLQELSLKFDKLFQRMTGGGASLILENPLDLESGLIIQANPRGKMLLNIDSMSGGEKTLTALAFLFAVQEYKPAPFYVLDEVDAALDKENSKKVAELIKSLSKEAQFIMITHNDTTIKYGDRVYGVTIEAGESKILGLELPG